MVADPFRPTMVDSLALASSTDAGFVDTLLGVLLATEARPVVPPSGSGSSMTRVAVFGSGGGSGVRTCFGPQAERVTTAAVAVNRATNRALFIPAKRG